MYNPKSYEHVANVGDRIKSMDFAGIEEHKDTYIVGEVLEKDGGCYTVKLDTRMYMGADITMKHLLNTGGEDIIYVPFRCGNEEITNSDYKVQRITKLGGK